MILQTEDLALELGDLVLGAVGIVQIALELAAEIFRILLGLHQLIREIQCGEHGCIGAADLGSAEGLAHLVIHILAHLLHVGGGFVCQQGVFFAANVDHDTVFHDIPP